MTDYPVYIEDGYTRDFYIAARPRLHRSMSGKFRPFLGRRRARIIEHVRSAKPGSGDGEDHAAMAIAHGIVTWDVRDKDGKAIEVVADAVKRIHPDALNRLWSIVVLGTDGGDAQPDDNGEIRPERFQEFSAILADAHPDEVLEKN